MIKGSNVHVYKLNKISDPEKLLGIRHAKSEIIVVCVNCAQA